MKLYLIRHAESSNNRLAFGLDYDAYMQQRSADPPLTDLGVRQAERVAEHLAGDAYPERRLENPSASASSGYGFAHLYCSPMLRALQTALPIAQSLGLQPQIWINLHEHGGVFRGNPRNGGDIEIILGMTRPAMQDSFPGYVLPDAVTDQGWWPGGYEDMPACYARAMRVARELRQRAQNADTQGAEERIGLISHGTFMDCLIKAFFNQIPERQFYYEHYNTAITRLDFRPDGRLRLRYLNRTQHIPPDMMSE